MGYLRKDEVMRTLQEDRETTLACYNSSEEREIVRFCYESIGRELEQLLQYIPENVVEQPKIYDVDNVVSNLEQLKLDGACEYCGYCKYLNECWDGDMSEEHAIDRAIEIVKRGGRDE